MENLDNYIKKNTLDLEEKNKNKKNKNDSMTDTSEDNEEEELELDFSLETNLHRKLRNMNLKFEKENRIKNKILKDRGDNTNEDSIEKKIKEKNKKLLELFKDDEKLYFKGASQYVLYKQKNNLINNKLPMSPISPISSGDKKILRSMSALSPQNSRFSRNKLPTSPKYNSNWNKNNNPNNNVFSNRLKRPMSMFDLYNENNVKKKKNIYENDIIKKLDVKFQIKKQNMDKIFNDEINNSILNEFYGKLSKNEYSKVFENPFYLEKNLDILKKPKEPKDKDLENKLEYLKKVIKMKYNEGLWSEDNSNNENKKNNLINVKSIFKMRKKKKIKINLKMMMMYLLMELNTIMMILKIVQILFLQNVDIIIKKLFNKILNEILNIKQILAKIFFYKNFFFFKFILIYNFILFIIIIAN